MCVCGGSNIYMYIYLYIYISVAVERVCMEGGRKERRTEGRGQCIHT